MARVIVRPKARRDIQQIIVHLMEHAGLTIAHRFHQATISTFEALAQMPDMGAPQKVRQREFAGVRMWRIEGFKSYLIFYFPRQDGVAIERIIHAKLDYQRVLNR